jgi:hypothetical protein
MSVRHNPAWSRAIRWYVSEGPKKRSPPGARKSILQRIFQGFSGPSPSGRKISFPFAS